MQQELSEHRNAGERENREDSGDRSGGEPFALSHTGSGPGVSTQGNACYTTDGQLIREILTQILFFLIFPSLSVSPLFLLLSLEHEAEVNARSAEAERDSPRVYITIRMICLSCEMNRLKIGF